MTDTGSGISQGHWISELMKACGLDAPHQERVLTEITKTYLQQRRPLWDNIPSFKELNGEIVDDEGIDLSEVPVCPKCALEMANRDEHSLWHTAQEKQVFDLEQKITELEQMIRGLLAGTTTAKTIKRDWITTNPLNPKWITDEEIRKYGHYGSKTTTADHDPF